MIKVSKVLKIVIFICFINQIINAEWLDISPKDVKFYEEQDEKEDITDPLWVHTKSLILYPFDLQELKVCLQKAFIYLNHSDAALILGKFTLFEYPLQNTLKEKHVQNKTFCQDYQTEDQQKLTLLKQLQEYDPINVFSRHFAKSLYYFHKSEQLLNPDAPIFVLFIFTLGQYTENTFNFAIQETYSFQNLFVELWQAAFNRKSKLRYQLFLSERSNCQLLYKLYKDQGLDLEQILLYRLQIKLQYVILDGTTDEFNLYIQDTEQLKLIRELYEGIGKYQEQEYVFYNKKLYEQDLIEFDKIKNKFDFYNQQEQNEQKDKKQEETQRGKLFRKFKNKQLDLIGSRLNMNSTNSYKFYDEFYKKATYIQKSLNSLLTAQKNSICGKCDYDKIYKLQQALKSLEHENEANLHVQNLNFTLSERTLFKNNDVQFEDIAEQNKTERRNQVEEILRNQAESNDPEALINLGDQYMKGKVSNNIAINTEQAYHYYEKAAQQNSAAGLASAASLLIEGRGTPKNITKGIQYYERAIELGHFAAGIGLGNVYLDGIGVEKNLTKAVYFYEISYRAGQLTCISDILEFSTLLITEFDDTPEYKTRGFEILKQTSKTNFEALYYLTFLFLQGVDIGMDCEDLLSIYENKKIYQPKNNIYSEKAVEKTQEGKYEDALIYSTFASFMGYEDSHLNTANLWRTLSKQQNREKNLNSSLYCAYNDYELCSLLFFLKDGLNQRNSSFLEAGHIIRSGSIALNKSYSNSSIFFKLFSQPPESLYSNSFHYESGEFVRKSILKAIEYMDEYILDMEIGFIYYFQAVYRRIYLYVLYFYEIIFG